MRDGAQIPLEPLFINGLFCAKIRQACYLSFTRGGIWATRRDPFSKDVAMLGIHRRHSHYVFGFIQSGLTSGIAAAIASYRLIAQGGFLPHWLGAWLVSWALMTPIVLFAAPAIRRLSNALTSDDHG